MNEQARRMVRAAMESNDPNICFNNGRDLFYGIGTEADWIAARICLERLEFNPDAMVMLGRIYQLGIGVKTDNAKIFTLYKRAADMGNAEAMFRLGKMYMSGTYVRKNEFQANRLINASKINGYHPDINDGVVTVCSTINVN